MIIPSWHYLLNKPEQTATIRTQPSDFFVSENLGYQFDDQGEHLMLEIEKTNLNTTAVVRELAHWANVNPKVIGYAGLKDRNAVTQQCFSIQLPGLESPDLALLERDGLKVLSSRRNSKKLRRGALKGNRFKLVLGGLSLTPALVERLSAIAQDGVPNYFGSQRFGFNGANVDAALLMFGGRKVKNRDKRSIYLSAARSFIFNDMVSQRIEQGLQHQLLDGDTVMLAGSKASFTPETNDSVISQRFNERDITLSAPMWGKGQLTSHGAGLVFEQAIALKHPELTIGLEAAGLKQERRSLMLYPLNMQWQELDNAIELSFELPAGSYATSVLREICQVVDGSYGTKTES